MFRMPLAAGLLKLAWQVSEKGDIAAKALAAVRIQYGHDLAMAQAAQWMRRCPRSELAAAAGLLAIQANDIVAAESYLQQGLSLGDDSSGSLELLELLVPTARYDQQAAGAVARRLAQRRDLSPITSRFVLNTLVWDDLWHGRPGDARASAERLLAIDRDAVARVAMWAIELNEGRDSAAAEQLRQAAGLNPTIRLYYQTVGMLSIGRLSDARELLVQLEDYDADLAALAAAKIREKEQLR
jgi:hypothetical protein